MAYILRLSNGRTWSLAASKGAAAWLKKFAAVSCLKACRQNGHPKILFTPLRPVTFADNRKFTADVWTTRTFSSSRFHSHQMTKDMICEIDVKSGRPQEVLGMWQAFFPVFDSAVESGGFPLHAALVASGRNGALLVGPSGAGKSTCCRRARPPWKALCDDEALVVRAKDGGYFSHPLPTWSDHILGRRRREPHSVEESVPVRAVFFLEKSKKDKIAPVDKAAAVARLQYSSQEICFRSRIYPPPAKEISPMIFSNVCRFVARVPSFILRLTTQSDFWLKIDEALKDAA